MVLGVNSIRKDIGIDAWNGLEIMDHERRKGLYTLNGGGLLSFGAYNGHQKL